MFYTFFTFLNLHIIYNRNNHSFASHFTSNIFSLCYLHSSFFAEERRIRKKRRRPGLKGTHTSFFYYSMNSLRSDSISYLVDQLKLRLDIIKKLACSKDLFVRNADNCSLRSLTEHFTNNISIFLLSIFTYCFREGANQLAAFLAITNITRKKITARNSSRQACRHFARKG